MEVLQTTNPLGVQALGNVLEGASVQQGRSDLSIHGVSQKQYHQD